MAIVLLTGTIRRINKTESVGTKGFLKRGFIIREDRPNYPASWALEAQKDFCKELDSYREGEDVTCEVEVTGREWTSPQGELKAFNTLKCFKITSRNQKPAKQDAYYAPPPEITEPMDDLPF